MNEYYKIAFDALVSSSPDMLFFKDANFIYMGCSNVFAAMAGVSSPQEIVGKSDFEIFPHQLATNFRQDDIALLKSDNAMIDKIEPITEQDGKRRFSMTSKYVLYNADGSIAGLYGIGKDVTPNVELRTEREMREVSRKMFGEVLEADLGANKVISAEGEHWAKSLELHPDISYEDALNFVAKKFLHPDCEQNFLHQFSLKNLFALIASGIDKFTFLTNHRIDGNEYRWIELTSLLHYSKITDTMHITTFLRDLDDEMRKKEELRIVAETDFLTGLLNRKTTIEQICNYFANEGQDKLHALLFIDLNRFKQINDTFGHAAGDDVLATVSEKIKSVFRKTDIVGRIGGDEFLVLVKDIEDAQVAESLVKKLLATTKTIYKNQQNSQTITCSVGISLFDKNKDFEQMYTEADKAMYKAKQTNSCNYEFF